jgi:glycerol-3-phosphate acyltransferase PlsY
VSDAAASAAPGAGPAAVAAVVAAAFLLGALPFGLWVGRLARGVDVRRLGSGNLGATNVYRTLGARLGLTVLALDAGKGVAAVLVARALAGPSFPGGANAAALTGAIAAVLGHSFTPFAGFRGGKGAATAAGAMLAATPAASLVALVGFLLAVALTRRISVGSLAAAALLPLSLWLVPFARQGSFAAWTGTAVGTLIILRHLPNLRRLLRGEEPAFRFRGGQAP